MKKLFLLLILGVRTCKFVVSICLNCTFLIVVNWSGFHDIHPEPKNSHTGELVSSPCAPLHAVFVIGSHVYGVTEQCTYSLIGFLHLGVLLASDRKMEHKMDRRCGMASAVMWALYQNIVVKRELSRKAKLSIYQLIYVPNLTYRHDLWVVSKSDTSGRNEFPP